MKFNMTVYMQCAITWHDIWYDITLYMTLHEMLWQNMTNGMTLHMTRHDTWHGMKYDITWHDIPLDIIYICMAWHDILHTKYNLTFDIPCNIS